jgi:hypothetical protein
MKLSCRAPGLLFGNERIRDLIWNTPPEGKQAGQHPQPGPPWTHEQNAVYLSHERAFGGSYWPVHFGQRAGDEPPPRCMRIDPGPMVRILDPS